MQLNRFMIRPYVEQALRDEIGPGDTTGGFLVGEDPVQTAQIYAKGSGIVCGLLLADETIRTVDPDARIDHMVKDGEDMGPGKVLLKIPDCACCRSMPCAAAAPTTTFSA